MSLLQLPLLLLVCRIGNRYTSCEPAPDDSNFGRQLFSRLVKLASPLAGYPFHPIHSAVAAYLPAEFRNIAADILGHLRHLTKM